MNCCSFRESDRREFLFFLCVCVFAIAHNRGGFDWLLRPRFLVKINPSFPPTMKRGLDYASKQVSDQEEEMWNSFDDGQIDSREPLLFSLTSPRLCVQGVKVKLPGIN